MPGRDMLSTSRDMRDCITHIVMEFKENGVALEAGPIATLALAMFQDVRLNTERDMMQAVIEGEKDLLRLKTKLLYEK